MSLSSPPTVSVVIPAFNAEAFIEKTLESIRAQTYASYEVVVVDDGSSDPTSQVVEAFFHRHGMPGRCIRQENRKIAGARNTGLRAAQGAYIALLDHDDLWYPDKLAVVMREFDCHPEVDLVCHNENITRHGRLIRVSRNGPASPKMYERLLMTGNTLSPSASVFRKEKALAIGGFREDPAFDTAEDYDFWLRLSRVARFHFIDQALGEYCVVDRAASRRIRYHHTNLENMLRDHFAAYFGERPGLINRMRIRRRLSLVYRSAGTQLMDRDEAPREQREYVFRMLREFPLEPKNMARFLLWAIRTARGGNAHAAVRP
jgi:glycosyltransferase involved in cell wall biosynthesis